MFSVPECNYFNDDEVACTAGANVDYEIAVMSVGVSGGFNHTSELKVLNYDQAMATIDKDKWLSQLIRNMKTSKA